MSFSRILILIYPLRVHQNKLTTTDIKKVLLASELFDFLHDTANETPDEVAKSPPKRASPAIRVNTKHKEVLDDRPSHKKIKSPLTVKSNDTS